MRRRQIAASAAVAVVLVGGGVTYAQAQGSSGSYRTATATVGNVDQVLSLAGTITASTRQDLSFGAAGTVASVKVTAGDEVAAGDVLARLDPTDLETTVTKARATLAKARAQLESDETSQSEAVADAASSSDTESKKTTTPTPKATATPKVTPSPKTTKAPSTTSPALKAALEKLTTQQTDVTTAQTAATDAIAAAKTALTGQVEACKAADEADPADAALTEACTTALDAVQAAQDVVAGKQDVLQTALVTLSGTLTTAVKALNESAAAAAKTTTPTQSSDSSTSSGSAAGSTEAKKATTAAASSSASSTQASGGSSGGAGGGGTVTAASLAKDQAAIDTAKADLTEAKRELSSAKLTAPFSGEILSVSAAKGDVVGASDAVFVIVGDGSTTVTTTVTLEQVDDVERGQTAAVTPAGAAEPISGTVTSIGLLPTTGTDTSTYPVTIDLDEDVTAPEGTTASIQLTIGTAADVVTVPSSAVSTTGRTTVSVLTDGKPVLTPVTVGIVGPTRTSITEGLKKGQAVILANLDAELPSGGSTTTRLPGSGGGFGGGGMGGSGMGGPPTGRG